MDSIDANFIRHNFFQHELGLILKKNYRPKTSFLNCNPDLRN